jgi:hypothetical protein
MFARLNFRVREHVDHLRLLVFDEVEQFGPVDRVHYQMGSLLANRWLGRIRSATVVAEGEAPPRRWRVPHPARHGDSACRHGSWVALRRRSVRPGLFVWSPFLLALLPGLRPAWRAAPDWVQGFALTGGAYLLVHWNLNL